MDNRTVGVLGGGQLGRMMAEAGHRLGIKLAILDPSGRDSAAGKVAELAIDGSFRDKDKIRELSKVSDVLTVEIEHVNCDVLQELEDEGVKIQPSPKCIRLIQDKYAQKVHLRSVGIPLPDFADTPTIESIESIGESFGYPMMLKSKRLAYDGRGNCVIQSKDTIQEAWTALGGDKGSELYVEKWCSFAKELAVMVVRGTASASTTGADQGTNKNNENGGENVLCYPVVETVQEGSICHSVLAPADVPPDVAKQALDIAARAIASLPGLGIFGVELFYIASTTASPQTQHQGQPQGLVLLNEIAPRPHNSGHYTMEGCFVDQFEAHLRAVLRLPLHPDQLALRGGVGAAVMVNVLGQGTDANTIPPLKDCLSLPGASVHWYSKAGTCRKGRKVGHVTFCAPSYAEAVLLANQIPSLRFAQVTANSTGHILGSGGGTARVGAGAAAGARPLVGIVMGSDSDLPAMSAACKVLEDFGVPFECTIVSAHRTPARMVAYATNAHQRGIQVIIAGAGGAAHLPGMVAALTPLPVIGVPVKSSTLSGVDSLYSIVQMPRGVPVATVAIGNAMNAGLLAVRILGGTGAGGGGGVKAGLMDKMLAWQGEQEGVVLQKADRIESIGYEKYLDGMASKSTEVKI